MSSEHGGELAELLGQTNDAEMASHRVQSCRRWRASVTWLAVSLLVIGTAAWAVSGQRIKRLGSLSRPNADIAAFSKQDWRHHQGMNCFNGHGGVPLSGPAELPGTWSVQGCLEQCDKDHACHAAVVSNSVPDGKGPCFLLKHITESECLQGMPYDTWSRSSDAVPRTAASSTRAPTTAPDSKVTATDSLTQAPSKQVTTTDASTRAPRSHIEMHEVVLDQHEIEELREPGAKHKKIATSGDADPSHDHMHEAARTKHKTENFSAPHTKHKKIATSGDAGSSHDHMHEAARAKHETEDLREPRAKHTEIATSEAADPESPNWGCGLLGFIPGISEGGRKVTKETQQLIDALKATSDFGKVSYWNWNFAPQTNKVHGTDETEVISSDFLFMPEMWGAGVSEDKYVRPAGESNFLDSDGNVCAATMGNILLGTNEPDIRGSCMGNMFGTCLTPCPASMSPAECPAAYLDDRLPRASPTASGQCNCWQFSHATGAGFWPLKGCAADQPLVKMWDDPACVGTVLANWKQTAAIAVAKGYKYLTTPLVAENLDYAEKFIKKACGCTTPDSCSCTEASCGCPVYVGFHFYAYDCQPETSGGYDTFKSRLQAVADIMDRYKFVKGAIINEVGMLNCASEDQNPICVPDSGKYPASKVKDHSCPSNHDLPDGLSTFVKQLFRYVADARTKDGREVVKGFSWFNQDRAGGTYNLRLFDSDGSLNKVGRSYMEACTEWRQPSTK